MENIDDNDDDIDNLNCDQLIERNKMIYRKERELAYSKGVLSQSDSKTFNVNIEVVISYLESIAPSFWLGLYEMLFQIDMACVKKYGIRAYSQNAEKNFYDLPEYIMDLPKDQHEIQEIPLELKDILHKSMDWHNRIHLSKRINGQSNYKSMENYYDQLRNMKLWLKCIDEEGIIRVTTDAMLYGLEHGSFEKALGDFSVE